MSFSGLIPLFVTCCIILFVALVVAISHNVKLYVKTAFGAICFSLAFWQVTVYISERVTTNLAAWNTVVFIGPTAAILSFFLFTKYLTPEKYGLRKAFASKADKLILSLVVLSTATQVVAIASGRIFSQVIYFHVNATYSYTRGGFYTVYIVGLVVLILAAASQLALTRQRNPPLSRLRQISDTILVTFAVSIIVGVTTNIFIPLLTNNEGTVGLGVLAIDFFAVGLAWSIIRYRFLDIRSYVFRAAGYVLALSFVAVIYGIVGGVVVAKLLHINIKSGTIDLLSLVTILLAVSFQPLRHYFDRITNEYFYRDAYNPQLFFNNLNLALVSTASLKEMSAEVVRLTEQTLRAEYCIILLNDKGSSKTRLVSPARQNVNAENVTKFLKGELLARYAHEPVLVADQLSLDDKDNELRMACIKRDVSVVARLVSRSGDAVQGYLIMGPKRSGNPYTRQDAQVINTVANQLSIAIQNALQFEEIQNFNETLQQRIHEATGKLRRTNARLKQLNEAKDEFVSMASHQLRTPLTSVEGYLSMVLEGDAGALNEQQRKLLEQSYNSSRQMVYLISDLLNISRISTGKFVIEPSVVDLDQVIQDEIGQLSEIAKNRNITLTYAKPATFPKLMLDETKTHQVVMNLIDNAVHYTQPGGNVTITLRETPTAVEYTVQDTGIGVPKAARFHLFTKFYRAPNAQKTRPDGTGLGLFMAKKVVTAQGGAIIFHSEEGKGSTFGFRLPKAGHLVAETQA